MSRVGVNVPGFEGRGMEVELGALGPPKLFLDGQPVPKAGKAGQYRLRRSDGQEVDAAIKAGIADVSLVVAGQTFRLTEPLAWYEWVLAAWPWRCWCWVGR